MKGFHGSIEKENLDNDNFRKVLYTGGHLQLVLMSLKPQEEIGEETHQNNDQFFRFEIGTGKCTIDENSYPVKEGDAILVPAGAKHNVINTGTEALKIYTIYGPPNHHDRIIRATKEEADKKDEKFDGVTSE
jgi:mannose-6-phosphate isomerase-like protein (cupin superfamily)